MIEEIPDPQRQGPKIMMYCIGIGMFTGFIFLTCLLLVTKDIDAVIDAKWGPLLQVFMDATKNKAGSVCMLIFPLICMLFTAITIMCTSSRMSYAFARDRGMPFSTVFAKVHPTLDVPLNALIWTAAWVIIFGCIFLGSSSTFNAITAASVVALGVTYAIPPAINVLRGRRMLPADRPFKLSEPLGWFCNIVSCIQSQILRYKSNQSLGWYRVVDSHYCAIRFPTRAPRHWQQHELCHCCIWCHASDCWRNLAIRWTHKLSWPSD